MRSGTDVDDDDDDDGEGVAQDVNSSAPNSKQREQLGVVERTADTLAINTNNTNNQLF